MKAGFAKAGVTPPLGMPMEGLGQPRGCEAIHDDLFVRALWLEHAGEEALIFGCDLLFFERVTVDRYKGALGRRFDLKPSQIFLNCSHSHAGPRLTRWAYSDGPDPLYLDQIEEALIESAAQARARQRVVTVWAGTARTGLPVSRRKIETDGKAHWAPYRQGTICDQVPFCLFRDEAGKAVSLLFSVSCHPSMIYECVISAEYPGAAMRKLNDYFQTDGSLFLQGAGGDTKPRHVAVEENHWRHGTWDEMEAAGSEVAEAVRAAAGKKLARIQPELRMLLTEVQWPLASPPARAEFEAVRDHPDERRERRLWAEDQLRQLDRLGRVPQGIPLGVHLLQLGRGLRLIGIEGEVLAKLGRQMLTVYDRGVTFPLGYTNATQVYLPVTEELPEGGYEVDSYWEYHWPAPLAPGGENVLLDALRQIRDQGRIANDGSSSLSIVTGPATGSTSGNRGRKRKLQSQGPRSRTTARRRKKRRGTS